MTAGDDLSQVNSEPLADDNSEPVNGEPLADDNSEPGSGMGVQQRLMTRNQ